MNSFCMLEYNVAPRSFIEQSAKTLALIRVLALIKTYAIQAELGTCPLSKHAFVSSH